MKMDTAYTLSLELVKGTIRRRMETGDDTWNVFGSTDSMTVNSSGFK